MQITRRLLWGASAAALTLARPGLIRAQGTAPIRIGEINSYTTQPAFTLPYRDAMLLAVEEINGKGGVLGCRSIRQRIEATAQPGQLALAHQRAQCHPRKAARFHVARAQQPLAASHVEDGRVSVFHGCIISYRRYLSIFTDTLKYSSCSPIQ